VLGRKLEAALAGVRRSAASLRSDAEAMDRGSARLAERRRETLERLSAALNAHDPQRTLERGYALAIGPGGEPLPTAATVQEAGTFDLRMADATLPAQLTDSDADVG
jgi:exodeoxyribonuclease VII large subunit